MGAEMQLQRKPWKWQISVWSEQDDSSFQQKFSACSDKTSWLRTEGGRGRGVHWAGETPECHKSQRLALTNVGVKMCGEFSYLYFEITGLFPPLSLPARQCFCLVAAVMMPKSLTMRFLIFRLEASRGTITPFSTAVIPVKTHFSN